MNSLRALVITLVFVASAGCKSRDAGNKVISELLRQSPSERTQTCLKYSEEDRVQLFFDSQERHHTFYGADECFARSSKAVVMTIRTKVVNGGSYDDLAHLLLILTRMRVEKKLSDAELDAPQLEAMCMKIAPSQINECLALVPR